MKQMYVNDRGKDDISQPRVLSETRGIHSFPQHVLIEPIDWKSPHSLSVGVSLSSQTRQPRGGEEHA